MLMEHRKRQKENYKKGKPAPEERKKTKRKK